jgi:co-chaperonin GroES (HSP10)
MNAQVIARRDYESLDEAFPVVDPVTRPFGNRVLVQIRTPKRRTAGGLYLPEETRDTELWNTQVAKVIALGPVAFCNRDTLEPWPEGLWCKVGDFVRCPKYGGDRWFMPVPNSQDQALFAMFKDLDISGAHTGDPLDVVAFI